MDIEEIILSEVTKLDENYKLMVLTFARSLVNQQDIEALKKDETDKD